MSGSPKNIQRDGYWIEPLSSALVTWSTAQAITTATGKSSGPTAVNIDKATAQSDHTAKVTCTVGNQVCVGVNMTPPVGDNVPFRVKASVPSYTYGAIMVGYAPASITGTDDAIDEPYYIPFYAEFDDMIIVPALDSGDGNYGRALHIAVCLQPAVALSAVDVPACISVQNLGLKPPTMQNAVS